MEEPSSMLWGVILVSVLVGVNAFFVAAEYALVRVRRTQMETLAAQGSSAAQGVLHGLQHLNRYIAGVQVGITLAGLASGLFGEPALAKLIAPVGNILFPVTFLGTEVANALATGLTLLVITYLLVVLGELVPKAITLQYPDRIALLIAKPIRLVVWMFTPVVWSMNALGNRLLHLLRLPPPEEAQGTYSVEELQLLIVQSHQAGILEDIERRVMQRGAQFGTLRVSDVMISRLDMVAVDLTQPVEKVLDQVAQTIHTRLPAYEGSRDRLVGILHLQDLFKALRQPQPIQDLRPLVRPPLFVAETMPLDELLHTFQQQHMQIALVIDEHGVLAGLITLEDVVEEVFGELHDTLEAVQPSIQQTPDGRLLVRGEVRLRELNEQLGWQLQEDDVDTIAGYIMKQLQRTARVGDTVDTPYGTVRVENMARVRITQVAFLPPDLSPP
ncbi:MAG: HlyC/CorC family transporter [Candidatus Tectomicrobia bacterium]|uniref:HlyC/CorC family transporter n=1 Tax=Tectimicrobiota bacterium TaxID=2528274 RepID=A0A937W8S8_UNCTE|nr:HlyC/CorC family transporter [Candidatus Tectomicrobia bacterium]